jgi:O-acetylhomoserine (thiol)-lyase
MALSCHPASAPHRQMSTEEERAAGASPEMIRLSIGIERVDDIIADVDPAWTQQPR